MNFGSWFRSPPTPAAPPASGSDDSANRIEYVDALLGMMLKKSLFSLHLTAADPLPLVGNVNGFVSTPPNYQAVINRLKVMARLNPVLYAAPMPGKIEIPCGSYILVYELRFDDKAAPPACLINLRVRNQ
jgi:hypothetical protein